MEIADCGKRASRLQIQNHVLIFLLQNGGLIRLRMGSDFFSRRLCSLFFMFIFRPYFLPKIPTEKRRVEAILRGQPAHQKPPSNLAPPGCSLAENFFL